LTKTKGFEGAIRACKDCLGKKGSLGGTKVSGDYARIVLQARFSKIRGRGREGSRGGEKRTSIFYRHKKEGKRPRLRRPKLDMARGESLAVGL